MVIAMTLDADFLGGKKKSTRKTKVSEDHLESNPPIFRNLNLDKQELLLSQAPTCLY